MEGALPVFCVKPERLPESAACGKSTAPVIFAVDRACSTRASAARRLRFCFNAFSSRAVNSGLLNFCHQFARSVAGVAFPSCQLSGVFISGRLYSGIIEQDVVNNTIERIRIFLIFYSDAKATTGSSFAALRDGR